MKISLWASDIWPPTQTITKFCTISCSSTSLLSLVELDLLLISSSIWGMSPLPVPEWWEPGLVWLLGGWEISPDWTKQWCPGGAAVPHLPGTQPVSPFGSILLCTRVPGEELCCGVGVERCVHCASTVLVMLLPVTGAECSQLESC